MSTKRLEELLDLKDKEIQRLEGELDKLREEKYTLEEELERDHTWSRHDVISADENAGLPLPRLEIRWIDRGADYRGYRWLARYDLVKRHLVDEIHRVPLGSTNVGATYNAPITRHHETGEEILSVPHRDGAHIAYDALTLNLPAYVCFGDRVEKADLTHPGAVKAVQRHNEESK